LRFGRRLYFSLGKKVDLNLKKNAFASVRPPFLKFNSNTLKDEMAQYLFVIKL
jgi:hypothetical protein